MYFGFEIQCNNFVVQGMGIWTVGIHGCEEKDKEGLQVCNAGYKYVCN